MMAHFNPLSLPESWPDDVPSGIVEVLNTALAKKPDDRFGTAGEMVRSLTTSTAINFSTLALGKSVTLSTTPPAPILSTAHIDWGEAPDVSSFYGRQAEAAQLTQWLVDDRCRLVGVLGMGGLGKTTLVTRLAEQVQGQFEYLIWRSLRNAPPLDEILWLIGFCFSPTRRLTIYLKRLTSASRC